MWRRWSCAAYLMMMMMRAHHEGGSKGTIQQGVRRRRGGAESTCTRSVVHRSSSRVVSPAAFADKLGKAASPWSSIVLKKGAQPRLPLLFQNNGSSTPPSAVMCSFRRFAIRLVGGTPEVTDGAAGSAIKGIGVIGVMPRNLPVSPAKSPASAVPSGFSASAAVLPAAEETAAGDRTRPSPIALTVFTISRDRRLSRWDLAEENDSLALTSCVDGREGRRRDEKGERRRWRLRWRAGCVTDVADVSGLDVVVLPGDAIQEKYCGASTSDKAVGSPAALVAVSGQGLQLVLFGAC